MTPETDEAINNGLAWLGRSPECRRLVRRRGLPGQYRGDQPGGIGVHGIGVEPGPRSLWCENRQGPRLRDGEYLAVGLHRVARSATHGPMYSHGFGTLFLAEAYGMTHRPEIREKLQKAVRLIVDSQNVEGGWRYQPVRRDADLSVTICQINALRAARTPGFMFRRTPSPPASDTSNSPRITMEASATSSTEGRPASFRGRRLAWSRSRARGNTTPRRSATGSPTCVNPPCLPPRAAKPLFLLRPVLCGPGDVASGRRRLDRVVSDNSQRAARATVGGRLLERQ